VKKFEYKILKAPDAIMEPLEISTKGYNYMTPEQWGEEAQ